MNSMCKIISLTSAAFSLQKTRRFFFIYTRINLFLFSLPIRIIEGE